MTPTSAAPVGASRETWAEEVARLQSEIAQRQSRLSFLVLGDPMKSVTVPIDTRFGFVSEHIGPQPGEPLCDGNELEATPPAPGNAAGGEGDDKVCPVCNGSKEIGDGHGAAACVACATPPCAQSTGAGRTCATCSAVLADGPQPAATYENQAATATPAGDDVERAVAAAYRDAARIAGYMTTWVRGHLALGDKGARIETAKEIQKAIEAAAALAAMPARRESIEDVPCRFGCEAATGIYYIPKGCSCWNDPVQALCEQHAIKAQSEGPITLIARLHMAVEVVDAHS